MKNLCPLRMKELLNHSYTAIAEDEPAMVKTDAKFHQWVEIMIKMETISSKEVLFTKSKNSSVENAPKVNSDTESEYDNQKPLPPLPKLSREEPVGTSIDVIPPTDLTQTSTLSDKTKQVNKKEASVKASKKRAQTKSPFVSNPSLDKKADSST
nr:hypothetical protein [Tanacetum cinerariifolium]